jgi:Zn-dependent peptidase ImmA (M78 family)
MDSIKREKIQNFAEKVHEKLGLEIPVDLPAVCQQLGGEVIGEDLGEEIDAKIEKSGDSFRIIFNRNRPNTRNNFSIAHELGHLFLHMGYLINPERWNSVSTYTDSVYYRFGHDIEELEANEFAAAFLMPEAAYRHEVNKSTKNGLCDISELAKRFGVSEEAAINRGRWLRIFSWN